MQDPSSADDLNLKAWRAMGDQTIADDDEPVLSHAIKLIIAVAVFARRRHRGGDRATFVKPPGLTPRGTAARTAGVSSMPTNFLEHQRAPGNGVVDHGAMPAGLLRAMPMRHWMARHAHRQLAGARLGALTFP
jgi:hypothetical protein